jgi:hypothetical protein
VLGVVEEACIVVVLKSVEFVCSSVAVVVDVEDVDVDVVVEDVVVEDVVDFSIDVDFIDDGNVDVNTDGDDDGDVVDKGVEKVPGSVVSCG